MLWWRTLACLTLLATLGVAPAAHAGEVTTNPDGTTNCGSRAGYDVEVGKRKHCRLGFSTLATVRRHFAADGVTEGDRFRVRVRNPATGRAHTLRCEVVGVGRFGSQTLCSGSGVYVNISRYA